VTSPPGAGNVLVTVTTRFGTAPGAPQFSYQGKSTIKDFKDIRDTKNRPDKIAEKITDKVTDKVRDKVRDKVADKVAEIAARRKVAETKPPEVLRGSAPLPQGEEPPALGPGGEEGAGRAFIEPEERPTVAGEVLDDEDEGSS
jgi:hypothetical protein